MNKLEFNSILPHHRPATTPLLLIGKLHVYIPPRYTKDEALAILAKVANPNHLTIVIHPRRPDIVV